jgi:hypothetical protein
MSSSGSHGLPRDEARAIERRMRNSAKKRVEQAELALHKYRAKAAAIMHAEGMHGSQEEPHSTYVYKILRHRDTGVRVRVLDTQADDAPPMDGTDVVHQYEVECQTHGTRGPSFASARSALAAARRSHEWCARCAELRSTQPRPRARTRAGNGNDGGRRNGGGDGKRSGKRAATSRGNVWP